MDQTLKALAGLLQNAIPTVVLVLILHFYLKRMLFRPLERVLEERNVATAGARKAAEESLRIAGQKTVAYEEAIRDARTQVYREQEETRRQLIAEQDMRLAEARRRIGDMVAQSRREIEAEAETARKSLHDSSGILAEQIANTILSRRPM